ncbi:hypothetical protein PR048_026640 [Dryococelus australis]|uniref:Uncharacterized protein n=1 Tax=Dryococelus australis TaxID=614101 RepID=A0ABQ9GLY8_9NEOP|nr:hypothetical protein PR048_026640 [Dryococelus australis]
MITAAANCNSNFPCVGNSDLTSLSPKCVRRHADASSLTVVDLTVVWGTSSSGAFCTLLRRCEGGVSLARRTIIGFINLQGEKSWERATIRPWFSCSWDATKPPRVNVATSPPWLEPPVAEMSVKAGDRLSAQPFTAEAAAMLVQAGDRLSAQPSAAMSVWVGQCWRCPSSSQLVDEQVRDGAGVNSHDTLSRTRVDASSRSGAPNARQLPMMEDSLCDFGCVLMASGCPSCQHPVFIASIDAILLTCIIGFRHTSGCCTQLCSLAGFQLTFSLATGCHCVRFQSLVCGRESSAAEKATNIGGSIDNGTCWCGSSEMAAPSSGLTCAAFVQRPGNYTNTDNLKRFLVIPLSDISLLFAPGFYELEECMRLGREGGGGWERKGVGVEKRGSEDVDEGNERILASTLKERSHGGLVDRLLASHQGKPGSIPGRVTLDFRKRESCRTMPLVGGFSWRSPIFPNLVFWGCSILTSFHPFIDSQDIIVKSRPNLLTELDSETIFTVETDMSENAVAAAISLPGRPVALLSRLLF